MQDTDYDLIIIGGGIQGAGVAREAIIQGLKVALYEKSDFLHATSSQSSKLVHGGLRYLESFEISLVKEALYERKVILDSAQHLVYPLKFLIPKFFSNRRPFFLYRVGLFLYNFLAGSKQLGKYGLENPKAIHNKYSFLSKDFNKAAYYFDARTDDFRLGLHWLLDAQEKGLMCQSYTKVNNVIKKDHCFEIEIEIESQSEKKTVTSKSVINAAGPWVNKIDGMIGHESQHRVKFGKGIHVVFETKINLKEAFLLEIPNEKRIFFILPWKKHRILVGTTDTEYFEDLNEIEINCSDIQYIKNALEQYTQSNYLSQLKPVALMAGVRPLVMKHTKSSQELSRGYKIEQTLEGMWNIVGGKYTVFREVGEKAVLKVLSFLNKEKKRDSESLALQQSPEDLDQFIKEHKNEIIESLGIQSQDAVSLLKRYGTGWPQLKPYFDKESSELIQPWYNEYAYYPNELNYSIEHEHCKTLEDYMMRRTSLFYTKTSGLEIIDQVLKVLVEKKLCSIQAANQQKEVYLSKVHEQRKLIESAFNA